MRTKPRLEITHDIAFRWLAQFFLTPLTEADLIRYSTPEGRAFLEACASHGALAPVVRMIADISAVQSEGPHAEALIESAFNRAFEIGGPRAAPPYASVYLSERGLMFQRPAQDMNRLLSQLDMRHDMSEPADHIGIQLNVAAEVLERERVGLEVPTCAHTFVQDHLLTWLPAFVVRCEALRGMPFFGVVARAALDLCEDETACAPRERQHA